MNKGFICLAGFLCGVVLCTFASAMPIPQFDAMAVPDRGHYMTLLVKGSVGALTEHGDQANADKLYNLFNDGEGAKEFVANLDTLRALDIKNAAEPNNKQPPYEVEQAFALTLKQNGIAVPLSFLLTINKDFKPSVPPKP